MSPCCGATYAGATDVAPSLEALGLPPPLPLPFSCSDLQLCRSWSRIMEGTGELTRTLSSSLLFLAAFVVLAMGSPACPVPSVGDSILGRPGSRWDLNPRMMHANYRIGVVEVLNYSFFLIKSIVLCFFFFLRSPEKRCSI